MPLVVPAVEIRLWAVLRPEEALMSARRRCHGVSIETMFVLFTLAIFLSLTMAICPLLIMAISTLKCSGLVQLGRYSSNVVAQGRHWLPIGEAAVMNDGMAVPSETFGRTSGTCISRDLSLTDRPMERHTCRLVNAR